jgi:hypothetical protein
MNDRRLRGGGEVTYKISGTITVTEESKPQEGGADTAAADTAPAAETAES